MLIIATSLYEATYCAAITCLLEQFKASDIVSAIESSFIIASGEQNDIEEIAKYLIFIENHYHVIHIVQSACESTDIIYATDQQNNKEVKYKEREPNGNIEGN